MEIEKETAERPLNVFPSQSGIDEVPIGKGFNKMSMMDEYPPGMATKIRIFKQKTR